MNGVVPSIHVSSFTVRQSPKPSEGKLQDADTFCWLAGELCPSDLNPLRPEPSAGHNLGKVFNIVS